MPTLVYADGFEHQVAASTGYGDANQKLFTSFTNPGQASFVTGRQGGSSIGMQLVENGVAAVNGAKAWMGTTAISGGATGSAAARTYVTSFYFKVAAAPAGNSNMMMAITTTNGTVRMNATGTIAINWGATTAATTTTYDDDAWHRVDWKVDTTANPHTQSATIDGVDSIGPITVANAAADITTIRVGSSVAGDDLTCIYDDWVCSATLADYPLGEYVIKALVPTGDGTHNAGTNTIEDNAGADINGTSVTAYPLVDEWPPNTTDYVMQSATGAGNYAEVTFDDVTGSIDCVVGLAAIWSAGTGVNNGTVRIVDSTPATLIDIYSGDQSDTALRYQAATVPAPGGTWSADEVNGLVARMGFSTDVVDVPRWSAIMIQYAQTPQTRLIVVNTIAATL